LLLSAGPSLVACQTAKTPTNDCAIVDGARSYDADSANEASRRFDQAGEASMDRGNSVDVAADAPALSPWVIFGGGSAGVTLGNRVAGDPAGNSFVVGSFDGPILFGTVPVSLSCGPCGLVGKLDPFGNVAWVVPLGSGTGGVVAWGVALGKSGEIFVVGRLQGTMTFGATTLTDKGQGDWVVVRLDPHGSPVWAVSFGGPNEDAAGAIALDESGDLLVLGGFQGTVAFGPATLSSAGGPEVALVRMTSSGQVVWAVSAGGAGADSGAGVAVDGAGNSFLATMVTGPATFGPFSTTGAGQSVVVAKVDAAGNFLWVAQATGALISAAGVAVDGSDDAYLVGGFVDAAQIGSAALTGSGTHLYLAKVSAAGTFVWAQATGPGHFVARGVSVAGSNAFVTGHAFGQNGFGPTMVTSLGSGAIVVAKADTTTGSWQGAVLGGGAFGSYGNAVAVHVDGRLVVVGDVLLGPSWNSTVTDTLTFGAQVFTIDGMRHLVVWSIAPGTL